jgi:hypothetical protein
LAKISPIAASLARQSQRGGPQWQDPRNRALIDAVYETLHQ